MNLDEDIINLHLNTSNNFTTYCNKNKDSKQCNKLKITEKTKDTTLSKIIDYVDNNILNDKEAAEMFTQRYFINLIIDEDQLNPHTLGGPLYPNLNFFKNYILPTYLPILTDNKETQEKIIQFYSNANRYLKQIDPYLINLFDIKRFFLNMTDNDFFNNAPHDLFFYSQNNEPEKYVYSLYFNELEKNGELLLDTGYNGHSTSTIIKKINDSNYEVNIINTNDGDYSETIISNDNKKGNFGVQCRGIMTFSIKDINYNDNRKNITARKRILKFIYFFSNYYNFMSNNFAEGNLYAYSLDNSSFYQKIVPLLFLDDDGNLLNVDKEGNLLNNSTIKLNNDKLTLINYAKDISEEKWEIMNIQSVGNCQFRAALYPILWKLNDVKSIKNADAFYKWYNIVKFYEIVKAFYIILKFNLISLKYQNIFNELLISYEKIVSKNVIYYKNTLDIVNDIKKKINLKFIRFLSGITQNKNNIKKNTSQIFNKKYSDINYTNVDFEKYTMHNDPIYTTINNTDQLIENLMLLSEYCEKIDETLTRKLLSNKNKFLFGNYYILAIEKYIEKIYEDIFRKDINIKVDDDHECFTKISTIIEKYISIRTTIPIFSHQYDQSPLYCMGILQIMGKLLGEEFKNKKNRLHESLLLERISNAIPLHKNQKIFYEKISKNINFAYDFLMFNFIEKNRFFTSDEYGDEFKYEEILFAKSFIFTDPKYAEKYNKKFEQILENFIKHYQKTLSPNNMSDLEKIKTNLNFAKFKYLFSEKNEDESISLEKKIKKYCAQNFNENTINLLKTIFMCNLPIIPPIGFTHYELKFKYDNIFIEVPAEKIYSMLAFDNINTPYYGKTIAVKTEYSVLYFLYHYSFCGKFKETNNFSSNCSNEVVKIINNNNMFVAGGGNVIQEIEKLTQKSEFDKTYVIDYATINKNNICYGPEIYGKLDKIHPFIPDNIKVTKEKFNEIKNTYDQNLNFINNNRKFMMQYLNNFVNLDIEDADKFDFTLKYLDNVIVLNSETNNYGAKTVECELNVEKFKDVKYDEININASFENFMDIVAKYKNNYYKDYENTKFKLMQEVQMSLQDTINYDNSFTMLSDIFTINLLYDRLLWHNFFDVLLLQKKITNDFYENAENTLNELKKINNNELNSTLSQYDEILKTKNNINFEIKKFHIEKKMFVHNLTNYETTKDEFVNEILKLSDYKILKPNYFNADSLLFNGKLYDLTNFTLLNSDKNYLIMYDSRNKILLEESRIKSVEYKIYKYNNDVKLFELLFEQKNELNSLFNHFHLVDNSNSNNYIYESTENIEAPLYLKNYYYWKVETTKNIIIGNLINNNNKPYFIDSKNQNYDLEIVDNKVVLMGDNNIMFMDVFGVFVNYENPLLIKFLCYLSNIVNMSDIILIKNNSESEYYLYLNNYQLDKINIKFIINNTAILLNDMEIIMDNEEANYNISRFYRYVSGLDNVFLLKKKDANLFKILSFPKQKIKVKDYENNYLINTINYNDTYHEYGYKPYIATWSINFKFNYSEGFSNYKLDLFELHDSGLYISNLNENNLTNYIYLINNYLFGEKIDIGRQLIQQLYNYLYTLSFIEKMKFLFSKNYYSKHAFNELLTTNWNYSYYLFDKLQLLSIWCNKYYYGEINFNKLKVENNLEKNIIDYDILCQKNINKYISKTYLPIDDKQLYSKLTFMHKNNLSLPIEIELKIPYYEKHILCCDSCGKKKSTFIPVRINDTVDKYTEYTLYYIYDALYRGLPSEYTIKISDILENETNPTQKPNHNSDFITYNISNKLNFYEYIDKCKENSFSVKLKYAEIDSQLSSYVNDIELDYHISFYNKLMEKFIPNINFEVNIIESKNENTIKMNRTKNKIVNNIKKNELQINSIEFKDFVDNKINDIKSYNLNQKKNNDFTIDNDLINNVEKYLNTLIYRYCYKNKDCDTYNYTSNSIYNHVCKITKLGIKFMITYMFLTKIKSIKKKTYTKLNEKNVDEYVDTYNLISANTIKNKKKIILLYEFMNGYFLREKQINYINNIINNFNDEKSRIYQIGMGVGKTSVLGPLISLIYSQEKNKNVINIMPSHLVYDAKNKYIQLLSPFYPINLRVLDNYSKSHNPLIYDMLHNKSNYIYLMSDKTSKVIYLNSKTDQIFNLNNYNIKKYSIINEENEIKNNYVINIDKLDKLLSNSVSLIDEIDSLSDSRKSELNYPFKNDSSPVELKFRIKHAQFLVHVISNITFSNNLDYIKKIGNDIIVYNFNDEVKNLIIAKVNEEYEKYFSDKSENIQYFDFDKLVKNGEIEIDSTKNNADINDNQRYILKHIYHDNLPTCLQQIYLLNYGLKLDEYLDKCHDISDPKFNLLAVPYVSAQKPADESKFSDIDLTLFYTFYSFKKLGQLRNYDISKIIDIYKTKHNCESYVLNNINTNAITYLRKLLETDIYLSEFKPMYESIIEYKHLTKYLITPLNAIQKKLCFDDNFMAEYLYELILDSSNIPSEFNDNLSFIDIISSNFTKTRVGFSGTPSNLVPIDISDNNDFHFLSTDLPNEKKSFIGENGLYNEYITSMLSMHYLQFIKNREINIYVYNQNKDIINDVLLNILDKSNGKYDCLIDVGALFKGTKPHDIALKIKTKHVNKKIVYVDIIKTKNKYIGENNISLDFKESDNVPGNFIYYDNSNVVGKDFKQSNDAIGLITINNKSTFTEFSQGLYRLRKLKEGQTVDFLIPLELYKKIEQVDIGEHNYLKKTIEITDIKLIKILEFLINQEKETEKNNKYNFYIQNARTLYRTKKYEELKKFHKSIGNNQHLYKCRGYINELNNVIDEMLEYEYKTTISEYHKKIIEKINEQINMPQITDCLNNIKLLNFGQNNGVVESLSVSQSLQLALSQAMSESQYSQKKNSNPLPFNKYYFDKNDLITQKINITPTIIMSENGLSNTKLANEISLSDFVALNYNGDPAVQKNIYLIKGPYTNLFNVEQIILSNGKFINGSPFNQIGSGYVKLKNGKIPQSFNENLNLLKDFSVYNKGIKKDIYDMLINNNETYILPFKNIILNMNTKNNKNVNILDEGDFMEDSDFNNNSMSKFNRYLSILQASSISNKILDKITHAIKYIKRKDSTYEIGEIIDLKLGKVEFNQIQFGGDIKSKNKNYKHLYFKYKTKYIKLKKSM